MTCKESKNKQAYSNNTEIVSEIIVTKDSSLVENYFFAIDMYLEVRSDDRFQVFYLNYEDMDFMESNSKITKVNGREGIQKIEFILPDEVTPSRLRFDFGENSKQQIIGYQRIDIKYQNKIYRMDFDGFRKLFSPNGYTELREGIMSIDNKSINGDYDPYYVSVPIEDIMFELMYY